MQVIEECQLVAKLPLVIVDYAHTPDALRVVLKTARQRVRGRIWTVFGCGGDRYCGKRSGMGRIASLISDFVILTSDNPRNEDPDKILCDILEGITPQMRSRLAVIHDRQRAIREAILRAENDDIVLIAGKGHERFQIVGDTKRPFDDVVEARNSLVLRREL